MEERLKYIFSVVNEWLRFAEAKNAALLVAASGLLLVLYQKSPDVSASACVRILFLIGSGSVLVAAIISICSFIPQLVFPWLGFRKSPSVEDNLYFFGHLANYSPRGLVEALYRASGQSFANHKIERDLAGQIIINSQISLKKFNMFTVSAWFLLAGIVLLVSTAIILNLK